MAIRQRRHLHHRYWPYCQYGGFWHPPYFPLPPWGMGRPTREEEIEDLKEHIEMLKEELKAAAADLKELEKSK